MTIDEITWVVDLIESEIEIYEKKHSTETINDKYWIGGADALVRLRVLLEQGGWGKKD